MKPRSILRWCILTTCASMAGCHEPGSLRSSAAPAFLSSQRPKRINDNTIQVQGVQVFAAAYLDDDYRYPESCRYGVIIKNKPAGPWRWELYDSSEGTSPGCEGLIGMSVKPYLKNQHWTKITCQLRQYDTHEESVTFSDLDVVRWQFFGFVSVTKARTVTTPSGVSVSLPVQNKESFMPGGGFWYEGPPHVVFVRVQISPGQTRNVLPGSPLYQRHGIPVSLSVNTAPPIMMNSNSGDSALRQLTMTLTDRKATHIDTLGLVVQQRADLQSIPLTFQVPIAPKMPLALLAEEDLHTLPLSSTPQSK